MIRHPSFVGARLLSLGLALVLAAPLRAAADSLLPARAVAAPPEELLSGRLRLPDPFDLARTSGVSWWPLRLDASGRARLRVPVEGGSLTLACVAPGAEVLTLSVGEPDGPLRSLDDRLGAGLAEVRVTTLPGLPGDVQVWQLTTARRGDWIVALEGPPVAGIDGRTDLALLVSTGGEARLRSALTSWELLPGGEAGLAAWLDAAPGGRLTRVGYEVVTPDGTLLAGSLHDDGLGLDARAGDGRHTAGLPLLPPGRNVARVVAHGVDAMGRPFVRSAWHVLPVAWPGARLGDDVLATPLSDGRLALDVPVLGLAPGERAHVSAELWATGGDGTSAPAAWLSRIARPAPLVDDVPRVRLVLHPGWLQRAAATAPLELRAVRLQDVDSHVPRDVAARLAVPDAGWAAQLVMPPSPPPITPAMTMGAPPADGLGGSGATGARLDAGLVKPDGPVERGLLLTHGYCSEGVWPLGDFSGLLLEFLDANQSRSHDAFAQLLGAFGAQVHSFGIVGHSQGGCAALHLHTYYDSGLDLAVGERLIQSVGSPYQGTPLAGDIAALGSIFGAGCGTNDDLTPAGSALWLAGIPGWARDDVHYWTTSTGGLWCDFLSNLLLGNPNDGVVEMSRGQLAGAVDMGHLEDWCHTTGMNDPPQYQDAARNLEMDAHAAR